MTAPYTRPRAAGALMIAAALCVSCAAGAAPSGSPERAVLLLAADELRFDPPLLVAPAAAQLHVVLENREREIPHNFAVYTDPSARAAVYVGGVSFGVTTTTERLGPLEVGAYFFRCDVHPLTMTGTLDVE